MEFEGLPVSNEKLGIEYSSKGTSFKLWSPMRDRVELLLYSDAQTIRRKALLMDKSEDGVHSIYVEGDLKGYFYTYLIEGQWEVTDPYSISSSVNSLRSAIIDLDQTDPEGWNRDYQTAAFEMPIIYEVHIKDFTGHPSSGIDQRGSYLAFGQEGGSYKDLTTGLDHLKELGVSHIHLMPVADFLTVNEEKEFFYDDTNYNWGYDPELYNVPEGSYASDPTDPLSRVRDLKTLIMKVHQAGLKIILDVVYNHTYRTEDSNFNIINPGYFYRQAADGSFSNGSGVGNEIASERPMVRKFILDSLLYWMDEYKVDGFRFDLMALTDLDTVKEIVAKLRGQNPHVLIYGEPWAGAASALDHDKMVLKGRQIDQGFALFNDDLRDAIKGNNDGVDMGFAQGNLDYKLAVERGIAGSIYYDKAHIGFAGRASESINYVNSHDNLIIRDKIEKSLPHLSEEDLIRVNKLAFSLLFTSQGIPFFHAGNEFYRTKYMNHNSYNAPLSINGIDWSNKEKYIGFYKYFKDLISLRKSYPAFGLDRADQIKKRLKFMAYSEPCNFIAYSILMDRGEDSLFIIHNARREACFMSRLTIIRHLNDAYKKNFKNIEIRLVLDEKGIYKDRPLLEDYGFRLPSYGSQVYQIKPYE